MLKRLLVAIALLLATLSAPAALSAGQHAVADGCFPPVEVPSPSMDAPPTMSAASSENVAGIRQRAPWA